DEKKNGRASNESQWFPGSPDVVDPAAAGAAVLPLCNVAPNGSTRGADGSVAAVRIRTCRVPPHRSSDLSAPRIRNRHAEAGRGPESEAGRGDPNPQQVRN